MTRNQKHAYMRIAHAAQTLQEPDATEREIRSAQVSLFRGIRALSESYGNPRPLSRAVIAWSAWLDTVMFRADETE